MAGGVRSQDEFHRRSTWKAGVEVMGAANRDRSGGTWGA